MQIITFHLGKKIYALETTKVVSVNELAKITKVYNTSDYIAGLTNLRGRVIPLLDITTKLDTELLGEKKEMLLVAVEGEQCGIVIDMVDEVIDFDGDVVNMSEATREDSIIKGIMHINDSIVTLIDAEKLMNMSF